MPSPHRNGDAAAALGRHDHHDHHDQDHGHFLSTIAERKLRRLNLVILLFRLAAFCFSIAAAVFAATNASRSPSSPSWLNFDSFRFVFAANAIVAVYSLFEMSASIWEILKGATLLPEPVQLWFDFSHDQVFAYMAVAAGAAGATEARRLRDSRACAGEGAFCVQADISIALGFAGFVFVAVSSVMSGFRVACYTLTVTGTRSRV